MLNKLRITALAALTLFLVACAPKESDVSSAPAAATAAPAAEVENRFADILSGAHRSDANKARDQWRHPVETLEFFGVTESSTVMEIWPGGGWYSEILAPYLRNTGTYIAAGWDPDSEIEFIRNAVTKYQDMLGASPEIYDQVQMAVLMPPTLLEPVEPGSVDVVVTFRNIHNWMPRNSQTAMMETIYKSLKPGGVLGIVEHRGVAGTEQDPAAKTGYVNEDYAIALAEAAGFVLDGKSEINANAADTKDHPEGVWTLPPTLRLKDQDKEKYLAIGESDRFTLRFIKPAN